MSRSGLGLLNKCYTGGYIRRNRSLARGLLGRLCILWRMDLNILCRKSRTCCRLRLVCLGSNLSHRLSMWRLCLNMLYNLLRRCRICLSLCLVRICLGKNLCFHSLDSSLCRLYTWNMGGYSLFGCKHYLVPKRIHLHIRYKWTGFLNTTNKDGNMYNVHLNLERFQQDMFYTVFPTLRYKWHKSYGIFHSHSTS